jgi:ribosome-binding factor A
VSNRRLERVAKVIKQQTSLVIQHELADPRMGFVTVAEVRVTADLRIANIDVSILGPEADVTKSFAALKQAELFIRGKLAPHLRMKYAPQIIFHLSEGFRHVTRINQILGELAVERGFEIPAEEPADPTGAIDNSQPVEDDDLMDEDDSDEDDFDEDH